MRHACRGFGPSNPQGMAARELRSEHQSPTRKCAMHRECYPCGTLISLTLTPRYRRTAKGQIGTSTSLRRRNASSAQRDFGHSIQCTFASTACIPDHREKSRTAGYGDGFTLISLPQMHLRSILAGTGPTPITIPEMLRPKIGKLTGSGGSRQRNSSNG